MITACSNQVNENNNQSKEKEQTNSINAEKKEVADKLEIYYFHSTARCYSCKTIGQYVNETITQKYNEQLGNGKIDYREINIDLPENKEIAFKFKASGSSLFINKIKDGQDNIEQDMNVWRLLGDETKFKNYLEDKINNYLGL